MFDDYTSALRSWNISKVLHGAYPSKINMYRVHKPDKRFSSNFPCEFRKCYPLQVWCDFKSIGPFFSVLRLVHELLGQTSYLWLYNYIWEQIIWSKWVQNGTMLYPNTSLLWRRWDGCNIHIGMTFIFVALSTCKLRRITHKLSKAQRALC